MSREKRIASQGGHFWKADGVCPSCRETLNLRKEITVGNVWDRHHQGRLHSGVTFMKTGRVWEWGCPRLTKLGYGEDGPRGEKLDSNRPV